MYLNSAQKIQNIFRHRYDFLRQIVFTNIQVPNTWFYVYVDLQKL